MSYLNQPPILGGDFGNDSILSFPKFSSRSPQSIKRVARNTAGYKILRNSSVQDESQDTVFLPEEGNSHTREIFSDSLLQNENQDSGFFSEEGNSHPQMASLSTALMDTPASGHEGVQHQNSASSIVLEGGKTEHQIQSMMSRSDDSRRQLDHFKLTRTRPNTPEGAQPGSNSPSLVTGRHNNRPNQYDLVEMDGVSENGEKSDRAVEQYDSTENSGFVDETKQVIKCCCAYTIIKSLSEKKEKPKLSNHWAFVWVSGIYSL